MNDLPLFITSTGVSNGMDSIVDAGSTSENNRYSQNYIGSAMNHTNGSVADLLPVKIVVSSKILNYLSSLD